jgi:hypothetical protein
MEMAKTNPSTIVLKEVGEALYKEYPLAPLDASGNGAITPGMLVELTAGEVRPHSSQAGDVAPTMIAVEGLNLDASSITMGDIDTDYDDDNGAVKVWFPKSGSEAYMLLGAGANVSKHGLLQSASDGYLMAYNASSPTPRRAVARALEDKNNSAGSAAVRIKVEVI